ARRRRDARARRLDESRSGDHARAAAVRAGRGPALRPLHGKGGGSTPDPPADPDERSRHHRARAARDKEPLMKLSKTISTIALVSVLAGAATSALAAATIGQPAPAFSVADTKGKPRTLAEFKGKRVVLEWHNQGCPFVVKHYDSGNMQRLQQKLTGDGVVWLTVISSAEGKQGS